jgi:PepSY-associated transmembrane protein
VNKLIKRIHIYLGLLNLSFVLIFGVTGTVATLRHTPYRLPNPEQPPGYEPYEAAAGLTDKQVADDIYRRLKIPLSSPAGDWAIRRDYQNDLLVDFYTINGPYRVTLLEKENRLRIERVQESIWLYIDNLHGHTLREPGTELPLRMWACYNEFSIWSLLGMALSGVYLGLTSRPKYEPARYALASGALVFLVLYIATRW